VCPAASHRSNRAPSPPPHCLLPHRCLPWCRITFPRAVLVEGGRLAARTPCTTPPLKVRVHTAVRSLALGAGAAREFPSRCCYLPPPHFLCCSLAWCRRLSAAILPQRGLFPPCVRLRAAGTYTCTNAGQPPASGRRGGGGRGAATSRRTVGECGARVSSGASGWCGDGTVGYARPMRAPPVGE
jgi:hypothetical protein